MEIAFSCKTLVFDASAFINLAASEYCIDVFSAINSKCIISFQVLNELLVRSKFYSSREAIISALIEQNKLSVTHLNLSEASHFIDLVSADETRGLDDGEASTLALARNRNGIAIIDEKKATRIAAESSPIIESASTIDLLYWISCNNTYKIPINIAVINALINSKMRVPQHHEKWVLGLIPADILPRCTSLRLSLRS